MTPHRPNFFIIGAPKSGTTSLYEYLDGHPDIYMSPVKEPFHFSPDVVTGPRRRYPYSTDHVEYLSLFAGAGDAKRVGEASTTYLTSHEAPALIRAFAPEALLIAMLRNPVDTIQSLHNERVSQGVEDITDFEQAVEADDDRRAGRRLPQGASPLGATYRDTAMYGAQLDRWLAVFDRHQLLIVVFDDFAARTEAEFVAVLRFLGIDDGYRPSTFGARNPSHRMRGGLVGAVLASRPTIFARRRLLPALIGENRTARLARQFRLSRIARREHHRDPIPAALRHRLELEFAADVARLSQLLGRDMSSLWFGRPNSSAE